MTSHHLFFKPAAMIWANNSIMPAMKYAYILHGIPLRKSRFVAELQLPWSKDHLKLLIVVLQPLISHELALKSLCSLKILSNNQHLSRITSKRPTAIARILRLVFNFSPLISATFEIVCSYIFADYCMQQDIFQGNPVAWRSSYEGPNAFAVKLILHFSCFPRHQWRLSRKLHFSIFILAAVRARALVSR